MKSPRDRQLKPGKDYLTREGAPGAPNTAAAARVPGPADKVGGDDPGAQLPRDHRSAKNKVQP